jgi:hypothetical protein
MEYMYEFGEKVRPIPIDEAAVWALVTYPALVLEEQVAAEVQMFAVFQPVPGVNESTVALLKREEITLRAFAVLDW